MFVNIFTGDDKYSLLNRDNLRPPIQGQLCKKEKTFPDFFFCIFEMLLKF